MCRTAIGKSLPLSSPRVHAMSLVVLTSGSGRGLRRQGESGSAADGSLFFLVHSVVDGGGPCLWGPRGCAMCSGCVVNAVVDGSLNVAVLSLIPEEYASLVCVSHWSSFRAGVVRSRLRHCRRSVLRPSTSCASSSRSQSLTCARQPPGSRPRSALRAHRPVPG